MASIKPRQAQSGRRWDVRYRTPDGDLRRKTFLRKVDAERFASTVEADKYRGNFVDPQAGRITFKAYAEKWLEAQTFDRRTREALELWLPKHVYSVLGGIAIGAIRPTTVQTWLSTKTSLSDSYQLSLFKYVSASGLPAMTASSPRIPAPRPRCGDHACERGRSSHGPSRR
jgi:hypothetical protein